MNANILGAVARRLVMNFRNDSGLTAGNRILIASCLFHLARLTEEMTATTTDLWIKAIAGRVNGFSQIRLLDVCREFFRNEPDAFRGLWRGEAAPIYNFLLRAGDKSEPYRDILRMTLSAIAFECSGGANTGAEMKLKLEVEKTLDSDEWMNLFYLKDDISRAVNAEIGEYAYSHFAAGRESSAEINLEVIM